ncbi:MAG: hypothetical protein DU429_04465 [Candidatus Tokpelaia sp.]|uniref:hypothetical protein n=1 Tax=Candidatus Tokpelaia sp. TaxID=2233777 RepID=UPI00123AC852|nr:hypothetical protein [Candidatus Tokpelaia sp.]KAA6204922.1 MAG: hypothetical protein DU430_05920 [Candidatus Tokpelaia sp.]KAA6207099.1 MAG: hypothetical protein DU429_04465 [Candidatus Tokpelaia sp.]
MKKRKRRLSWVAKKCLPRFESLGENCEFGFFQRKNKQEISSLFRWTFIHDYNKLIELIENDFQDLFLFENLTPIGGDDSDGVLDRKYQIAFHSAMTGHEESGAFVWGFPEPENLQIYQQEKSKIAHFVDKFRLSLRDDNKIFVVKRKEGGTLETGRKLAALLARLSRAKIFCVEENADPEQQGKLYRISDNLYQGFIDRFSAQETTYKISSLWWPLITEAAAVIPDERPKNRLYRFFTGS